MDPSDSGPWIDNVPVADHRTGHTLSFLGLFLFTFIVYARPYEWSKSLLWLSSSALWVALSTLIVFVAVQFSLENRLTVPAREVWLALCLLITGFLSIPLALSPWQAWTQFVDYFKVIVIFVLMVNVLRTKWRLKALLHLILAITVVLTAAAVRDYATGNFVLGGTRIKGAIGNLFSNPNDLALHLVTMVPLALALTFAARNLISKFFYLSLALSIIAGVLATFSRGGYLGLVLVLIVLMWRVVRRGKVIVLPCLLGLLLVMPLLAGYASRFSTEEASAVARLDDLKRSVYVALHHPLVGVGMNNYQFYSNRQLVTHNAYTQVWVEMGSIALVLYIALLWAPIRILRKAGSILPGRKRDETGFLAIGLEASIYGYMVCSFFASVAYLWNLYYLLAFSIALGRIYSDSAPGPALIPQDAAPEFGGENNQNGPTPATPANHDAVHDR